MCGAVATENYSTLLMHITKYDIIYVNVNVGHHGHPCYVRHELIDHRRRCTGNLVCECVGWFNSSMELFWNHWRPEWCQQHHQASLDSQWSLTGHYRLSHKHGKYFWWNWIVHEIAYLFSSSLDKTVRIWNLYSHQCISTISTPDAVHCVCFPWIYPIFSIFFWLLKFPSKIYT